MGETVRFFAVGHWTLCRGQTNTLSQTDASTAKGLEKYGNELMEVRQRVVASTAKGFVGGLNPLDPARRLPRHFTYWWRMLIYRPRDLLLAITRPPWRFRYIGFGKSVYRLGWGRSTDRVRVGIPTYPNPVYRLARLGIPTDTHSVYRHCRCPRVMTGTAAAGRGN